MQAIPQGTTNDALRTIKIRVMTAADPFAPKSSGVAGTKAKLAFGDGGPVDSDNGIEAVNTATGHYQLTLSDDEVANAVPGVLSYDAAGCAPLDRYFQIGNAAMLTTPPTPEEFAAASRDDAIQMLRDGMTASTGDGAGTMTLKDSGGDEVTIAIMRSAARPIVATADPEA